MIVPFTVFVFPPAVPDTTKLNVPSAVGVPLIVYVEPLPEPVTPAGRPVTPNVVEGLSDVTTIFVIALPTITS